MTTTYHIPVLLQESVNALVHNPNGTYVDLTFGGGGHSRAILNLLSNKGRLISFDKDQHAIHNAINDPRFTLVNHNFRYMRQFLEYLNCTPIDGILGDLGISSYQIDFNDRGFAHRSDGPLDMRMDTQSPLTAAKVLQSYTEKQLLDVFNHYGEIKNAYKLVKTIIQNRNGLAFSTVEHFKNTIDSCIPKNESAKYLSQVFQALRIEVNQELTDLKQVLHDAEFVLGEGGKLVIISYHSLEDRLVKNYLNSGNFDGIRHTDVFGHRVQPFECKPNKAIVPTDEELERNKRSRSAKLRIGVRNEVVRQHNLDENPSELLSNSPVKSSSKKKK
jgi:16S rRNA (cytosine1402-N4)-methyltransferase